MIVSNPFVFLFIIIIILGICYVDIAIGSLSLVLLFIILFSLSSTPNKIEGFTNDDTYDSDGDDTSDDTNNNKMHKKHKKHITKLSNNTNSIDINSNAPEKKYSRMENNLKIKAEKDRKLDEKVKSFKDIVLGTINKFQKDNDDNYKQALLENKRAMYQDELNHISNDNEDNVNNQHDSSNNSSIKIKKHNVRNRKKENFQTVETRSLDPTKEEDTNLLLTKEILQDMLNRIEYNYESNKYLRKYIKHRVEEIIDINKLAEDE